MVIGKIVTVKLIRKWYADFLAHQEDNGWQLRYIARYLKAWRDQEYKDGGGPSLDIADDYSKSKLSIC